MGKPGNIVDKQVGSRVRSVRDAARVSVYDAALSIGVSVETYLRLEAGQERFKAPHLRALAERYSVCVTKFFSSIDLSEMDGKSPSNVVPLFSSMH